MKKLLLTLTLLIGFNNEVLAQSKGDYVVQGRVPNAVLVNEKIIINFNFINRI